MSRGSEASATGATAERVRGRPLRVGLNLLFLRERAGGAGRYARELPGALLAAEPDTEVHVFVSAGAPADLREEPWAGAVRWTTLPTPGSLPAAASLAERVLLPASAALQRLDVLHSPANSGPARVPGVATVVSILDLIWLHRAEEWEASRRVQRRMLRRVRGCARGADRIFAISRAAAEDLVASFAIERGRIEVTPLGVREPEGPATAERELRERLSLGSSRVILCVAQKRPYKNLHRLIEALPLIDEHSLLVLPGAPTPYERQLRAKADELGVSERVRFPDWLSEAELAGLYRCSDAFVLPSLIEGFGLPVLEAMAHGVPVACSNVSALPEVAGDAALTFDPERPEQIAGAVRRLLDERELAQRLRERGAARVREHDWLRTGTASLRGYRHALAARRSR